MIPRSLRRAARAAAALTTQGYWDWFGYNGPDFAVRSAPQMTAITNMVHALGG